MGKILITGGAGYIGSHVLKEIIKQFGSHNIIVVDDLSNGSVESLLGVEFIQGSIGSSDVLDQVFKNDIESVFHFAGSIIVSESTEKPLTYYRNNTLNSLSLLEYSHKNNVKNFIFSSTASVYGELEVESISEEFLKAPVNPYAQSKAMFEEMLIDSCSVSSMNYIIFRYFNVAGADYENGLGQRGKVATHLFKICAQAAVGKRSGVKIFGDNYDTPDGTCIRDYIHVRDLVDVHLLGLDYLVKEKKSNVFNCGYNKGFSVKEVVEEVLKFSTNQFLVEYTDRRAGDVSRLVANTDKLQRLLGWKPRYNDISLIAESAINWEKRI